MKIFLSFITVILFLSLFILSCSEEIISPPQLIDNTFNGFESYKVAEIFAKNCAQSGCHAGAEPVHNLSFESWPEMIKGLQGRPLSDFSEHKKSAFLHDDGVYGGEAVIPFNAERPNKFDWEYIEKGPQVWRVNISKK